MAKIEGSFERKVEISAPIKLLVETGSGEITVRRGADDKVAVKGRFTVRAPGDLAEEIAEMIEADPPIEVIDQTIEIGDLSKYQDELGFFEKWGTSIAMSFEIEAPYETEAELDSGSGDQLVQGIRGPVRADAGSGDVTVEESEREVFIDTGSGNIAVRGASEVEADAGSGSVTLSDIAGDVGVDVGSGNVSLANVGGSIAVDTGSGNVEIDSAVPEEARWEIDTGSGNVRLNLPEDAQFQLYIDTASGRISVDFQLAEAKRLGKGELRGSVGERPKAEIRIDTSSGNVEIRKKGQAAHRAP